MGIVGVDDTANHLDQRFHPCVLLQAPHGTRGALVFQAGLLLGMKEEGVVQQQAQGQAAAGPFFVPLRG